MKKSTLIFAAESISFYSDAGELIHSGFNGSQYHHGHPTNNAPWFTGLSVIGEIQYDGSKISGSVVWNPETGWRGDLGYSNGRIGLDERAEFLRAHLGFRTLGSNHMLLGLEFKDVYLKYGEVAGYHGGAGLSHVAWTFRSLNTCHSFGDMKFDEKYSYKLIKIHSWLDRLR